jgi:hypothetical protein
MRALELAPFTKYYKGDQSELDKMGGYVACFQMKYAYCHVY